MFLDHCASKSINRRKKGVVVAGGVVLFTGEVWMVKKSNGSGSRRGLDLGDVWIWLLEEEDNKWIWRRVSPAMV